MIKVNEPEIVNLIDKSIEETREVLESGSSERVKDQIRVLIVTYGEKYGFETLNTGGKPQRNKALLSGQLRKLELLASGFDYTKNQNKTDLSVNTIATSNAYASNNVNIEMVFKEVIKSVEEDIHLSQEESDEIIGKIKELQSISNEKLSKKKTWNKMKDIMNWLSTKGLTTFLKVLPLLKLMFEETPAG